MRDEMDLEGHAATARDTKEHMVAAVGISDLDPMVTFHRKGKMVAIVQVSNVSGDMRDDALAVARMGSIGFRADRVVLTLEGYMRTVKVEGEPVVLPERGEYAKEFADNPGTDVVEVIIITEAKMGSTTTARLPFRYGDHGVVEWLPSTQGADIGTVPDLLSQYVEGAARIWKDLMVVAQDVFEQGPKEATERAARAAADVLAGEGHLVMMRPVPT